MKRGFIVGLAIVGCISMAFAGPKVKVDATEFDVGIVVEGTKEKVSHEFILTNTGNDVLRIKDVRAG